VAIICTVCVVVCGISVCAVSKLDLAWWTDHRPPAAAVVLASRALVSELGNTRRDTPGNTHTGRLHEPPARVARLSAMELTMKLPVKNIPWRNNNLSMLHTDPPLSEQGETVIGVYLLVLGKGLFRF